MGKPFVVLRFSLVFFVTSLLFTLLSWDRIEPHHDLEVPIKSGPEPLWILDQYGLLGMGLHASMHVLVGCMIASSSRLPDIIIAGGIVALPNQGRSFLTSGSFCTKSSLVIRRLRRKVSRNR